MARQSKRQRPSKADLQAMERIRNSTVIVTNAAADGWRQMESRTGSLHELLPLAGESPEELMVRRDVAGEIMEKVTDGLHEGWEDPGTGPDHITATMPPADGRIFAIASIRKNVMDQLPDIAEAAATDIVNQQISEHPPTGQFNRLGALQRAADKGVDMARQEVEQMFNQLAENRVAPDTPTTDAECQSGIESVRKIIYRAGETHLDYAMGKPKSAQHALNQSMAHVVLNHLHDMLEMAQSGWQGFNGPLRTAGSILTAMHLPQEHIHPNDISPVSTAARQVHELLEVFEQVNHSLTNGDVINRVHEAYEHRHRSVFKGATPVADEKRYMLAHNRLGDFMAEVRDGLEKQVLSFDGWSKPVQEGRHFDMMPLPPPLRLQ